MPLRDRGLDFGLGRSGVLAPIALPQHLHGEVVQLECDAKALCGSLGSAGPDGLCHGDIVESEPRREAALRDAVEFSRSRPVGVARTASLGIAQSFSESGAIVSHGATTRPRATLSFG